jgi:hypothetical protein
MQAAQAASPPSFTPGPGPTPFTPTPPSPYERAKAPLGGSDEAFLLGVARRRHFEVWSSGIDEMLQGVGGDPYRGLSNLGLRVPFRPTFDPDSRYLFNLASFSLAEGAKARIVGYRQFWSLGARIGPVGGPFRFVEQPVTQPNFHLPDGNVSWHMHRIGHHEVSKQRRLVPPADYFNTHKELRSTAWRMSNNPALLFEQWTPSGSFYVNLTSYTAPNKGRPWGASLQNNFGTFYDQKTDWTEHGAWHALDVPVDGPCTVAFQASVLQTDPTSRVLLPVPNPFFPNGLSDEEQFLLNFPFIEGQSTGAVIWRVAGALAVELDA